MALIRRACTVARHRIRWTSVRERVERLVRTLKPSQCSLPALTVTLGDDVERPSMSTTNPSPINQERREDGNTNNSPMIPAPTPTPTNRGGGSCSSLLFMIILLFMLMNNGTDDLIVRNQYRESLKSLRLQQSNFSAWLESGGDIEMSNFTMVRVQLRSDFSKGN